MLEKQLTVGMEEELFLVDVQTGELCARWPEVLVKACEATYPGQIVREFICGQVELISSPTNSVTALHEEMQALRHFLAQAANEHGLALLASSSHPKSKWYKQLPTKAKRYERLANVLQISSERMLVCGMHIHVGVDDIAARFALMNALLPYTPVFLALSTSSPYWSGRDTGLCSYRTSVIKGLPRSGMPPFFDTLKAYQSYVDSLIGTRAIDTGKELWWDMRLNSRFPTIEIRASDVCTSQSDAMAITALIQSLALYLIESNLQDTQSLKQAYHLALENCWRAQRYNLNELSLISSGHEQPQPFNEYLFELVSKLTPYAKRLGCASYLESCLAIPKKNTSAERQRKIYAEAIEAGLDRHQALDDVLIMLIQETALLKKIRSVLHENGRELVRG